MSFWKELRRRNVFKVGAAYLLVAWLLIQVVNNVAGPLDLPAWTPTLVIVLLGVGFPFALIFAWAYEVTPEGLKVTSEVRESESVTHVTGQKLNYVVTALLFVAVVAFAVDEYLIPEGAPRSAPASPAVSEEQASTGNGAREGRPRVAVLPCDNLSADQEDEFFAIGIHSEILNQLNKLSGLLVISGTSVQQYAEDRPPIPEIASDLDAQAIMECSVRYAGDSFLVTAQLIDPASDVHLFSDSYSGDTGDTSGIFETQADIAMNIANALNATYTQEEQGRLERVPTESFDAYALYLQARLGLTSIEERHALLDQALEIDPEFALAHAAKAWAYSESLTFTLFGDAPDEGEHAEVQSLVREYADRALMLDESLWLAHAALANMDFYTWRWPEAHAGFQRAYQSSEFNLAPYLFLSCYTGRHERAMRIARNLAERSPNQPTSNKFQGYAQAHAGDLESAEESLRLFLELDTDGLGDNWIGRNTLVQTLLAAGKNEAALEQLRQMERLRGAQPGFSPADAARFYAVLNQPEDAERLLAEALEAGADRQSDLGVLRAAGDFEGLLARLELAAERAASNEPDPAFYGVMDFKMNLLRDPVLERPEFVEVRKRLTGE